MSGAFLTAALGRVMLACSDWGGDWYKAIENYAFQDAVLCGYQNQLGGPVFGAFVLLGMVNLPIYIKQDSVLVPTAITLTIGGLFLTQVSGIVQGLTLTVLLFAIGLGPVLVIHRVVQ